MWNSDESFGSCLKRLRLSDGISLDQIQQQTNIPVKFLIAIEQDRFDDVPGGLYFISFVQQYAACFGLDGEKVLEALRAYRGREESASARTVLEGKIPSQVTDSEDQDRPATEERRPPLAPRISNRVFAVVSLLVPKRLAHEELGDAEEYIRRSERRAWEVYVKTVSAVFWVLVNSLGEITSVLWGKRPAPRAARDHDSKSQHLDTGPGEDTQ